MAQEINDNLREMQESMDAIEIALRQINAAVGLLVEAHRAPHGWEYAYAESRQEANRLGAFGWRVKAYVPARGDTESFFLMERGLWDDGSGHRPNTEE